MSRYGKIESGFWQNPKVRALSERARYLLTYLLSCPHGNAVGCFVLPDGYIAADLGWSMERVSETVSELSDKGFIERDSTSALLRLIGWWGHNKPENPNVILHLIKVFASIPNCKIKSSAIIALHETPDLHEKVTQTLAERLPKPSRNQEHNITEQEHKQEQEQEQSRPRTVSKAQDVERAFEIYNLAAEQVGWPKAQRMSEPRKKSFAGRLRECGGVEGWQAALAKATASDFLAGRSGRTNGHEGWSPDLDFFLKASNFTKLMEGKYDNRSNGGNGPPGSTDLQRGLAKLRESIHRDGEAFPEGGLAGGEEVLREPVG